MLKFFDLIHHVCRSMSISMAELWKCALCSFFCLFLSQLLSHLNTVHRNEVNFSQKCGLPGCPSETVYTSTNSLIKHVRTSHRVLLSCTYESVHNNPEDHNVIQEAGDTDTDETGNLFTIILRRICMYKCFSFPSAQFLHGKWNLNHWLGKAFFFLVRGGGVGT